MKIAIRIDDITKQMDWAAFYRFKGILDKLGVCPLIGVIPKNQDESLVCDPSKDEFWKVMNELGDAGWSIAQHGFNHLYTTQKRGIFPLNNFSEFAGLTFEEQFEKINSGKKILEENGIQTTIFMAPGHSFDRNTLKALRETGFLYITDGYGNKAYKYLGITFLPISFHFKGSFQKKKGYTTIVFHLNGMKEEQFVEIETLLTLHKNKLISYTEYMQQRPVKRNTVEGKCEFLLAFIKSIAMTVKRKLLGVLKNGKSN